MTISGFLVWAVVVYIALRAIRYVMGARIYLTSALRESRARPVDDAALAPGIVRILSSFDQELAAAGGRPLGYGQCAPLLTYYGAQDTFKIFALDSIAAVALVRRSLTPEYGGICELVFITEFANGRVLLTTSSRSSSLFATDNVRLEGCPGVGVAGLVERHALRVMEERTRSEVRPVATIKAGLDHWSSRLSTTRQQFRLRGWTRASADPALDSFTLRGALALVSYSTRVLAQPTGKAVTPPAPVTEQERSLRIEAELDAINSIAEVPERAPGTPWPLLAIIAMTVAVSFAAMTVLWDVEIATVIFSVIVLHEAGHAIAMRLLGYRDVHVFFVPLLGAVTIGQTTVSTVRSRVSMLLAGPVPGLWLAVLLMSLDRWFADAPVLFAGALAALLINGLNLLPITPFDGGRVVELLSRPESAGQPLLHALSVVGLLALAFFLKDMVIGAIGLLWFIAIWSHVLGHRLRKAIAAKTQDRGDFAAVVRAALEVMSEPAYAAWRSPSRQVMARNTAKLFGEPVATSGDRFWTIAAYLSGWIPAVIALFLWRDPL